MCGCQGRLSRSGQRARYPPARRSLAAGSLSRRGDFFSETVGVRTMSQRLIREIDVDDESIRWLWEERA